MYLICHLLCFLCQMLGERIPLRRVKTMRKALSGKNMLNNFLKEHAYRLSQISFRGSNLTSHPLRNIKDVSILGGWCSIMPPCSLARHGAYLEVPGGMLRLGFLQEAETLENRDPTRGEVTLILNCWSLWLGLAITRWQVNIHFCVKDVSFVWGWLFLLN